jgi:hypothetical protein
MSRMASRTALGLCIVQILRSFLILVFETSLNSLAVSFMVCESASMRLPFILFSLSCAAYSRWQSSIMS